MKHAEEFDEFLRKEVNLDPTRLGLLHRRVRSVSEYLSQKLDSYEKVENQGSYALGTVINPSDGQDYDSDILVYMADARNKRPQDRVEELYACLSGSGDYQGQLTMKSRSVEVDYSDGFHMDLVPCITRGGLQYVCNSDTGEFEATDGTGYREWFNGKTDITNGYLKAVTRLLKHMKNHKKSFTVPSVILTTLIGHSVHSNERGKRFKDVPDTLKTVSNRMNAFLQATPQMPRFRNPAQRSERFSKRDWNQNNHRNFQTNFRSYNDRINDAFEESNAQSSIQKWRNLFGSGFG